MIDEYTNISNSVPLGLDNGNGDTKTSHCCIRTGIVQVSDSPITNDNILEYKGKYYQVGVDRINIQDTKVDNDNVYLISLAAIAKELKARNLRSRRIILAVGLPIGRYSAEKNDFIRYLSRDKFIKFRYENDEYNIIIEKVLVYPQCYGAIVDRLPEMKGLTYVVDIGSWTVDTLKIINRVPDESGCSSEPIGVITCIKKIQEVCYEKLNSKLDEHLIQEYLIHGQINVDQEYINIIDDEIKKYTNKVFRTLVESGINVKISPVIFVGGGAFLMKKYAGIDQRNISYIEDVCANAKGYETLAKLYMNNKKG